MGDYVGRVSQHEQALEIGKMTQDIRLVFHQQDRFVATRGWYIRPLLGNGFSSVYAQVGQDLGDLAGIDLDRPQFIVRSPGQINVFTDEPIQLQRIVRQPPKGTMQKHQIFPKISFFTQAFVF